eukprot:gene17932-24327_t
MVGEHRKVVDTSFCGNDLDVGTLAIVSRGYRPAQADRRATRPQPREDPATRNPRPGRLATSSGGNTGLWVTPGGGGTKHRPGGEPGRIGYVDDKGALSLSDADRDLYKQCADTGVLDSALSCEDIVICYECFCKAGHVAGRAILGINSVATDAASSTLPPPRFGGGAGPLATLSSLSPRAPTATLYFLCCLYLVVPPSIRFSSSFTLPFARPHPRLPSRPFASNVVACLGLIPASQLQTIAVLRLESHGISEPPNINMSPPKPPLLVMFFMNTAIFIMIANAYLPKP